MKLLWKFFSFESFVVFLVVFASGVLRFYRIGDYLTFLGDEGRDALVVKGILEGNFTFLGPRASAGDFFLGPIYYYFMAPFLWLWHYDPVGPAIMIAILGTVTVFLVYLIGKRFFGTTAGLVSAALYGVSPIVIAYSRSSWNPNPMPFFSITILYLLYKVVTKKNNKLFLLIGLLFGITLQLHYLATFLGIIIIVYLLFSLWYKGGTTAIRGSLSDFARMLIGFTVGFSPFLAFELRHGFANTKTIFSFIFQNAVATQYTANTTFIGVIWDVFFRLFGRLITRFPPPEQVSVQTNPVTTFWYFATLLLAFVSIGIFLFQLYSFYKAKNEKEVMKYGLLFFWFFLGVLLFGFYKKQIYDYYFGFMFPAPFLLLGNALATIMRSKRQKRVGVVVGLAVFFYLLYYNLLGAPFFTSPNRQKEQVKTIADFVLSKTDGKPYNFALLTSGNSDHAYRYFFKLAGESPVTLDNVLSDPMRKTVTDQLLIVCEDQKCKPLGNSLWEVAGFGRAEIIGEWSVSVVTVYKLQHYKGK